MMSRYEGKKREVKYLNGRSLTRPNEGHGLEVDYGRGREVKRDDKRNYK